MAMKIGADDGSAGIMSEINTTPLVDIMLVLLIIFLVTIPVITKSVKVELPKAVNIPTVTKPENITISVDREGNMYWGTSRLSSVADLVEHVKIEAVKVPQPEIHIRGDKTALFKDVGRVIYGIQRGGVVKVGFITEPDRGIRGFR